MFPVAGLVARCRCRLACRLRNIAPIKVLYPDPSCIPGDETAFPGCRSPASINVAPVEIPDYLDRPQIVTRDGRNGVVLAEFDRWAGSLGENISAVLAEDLALLLGTDRVVVNPGAPFEKADYSVVTRVLRLDCLPGDHVLLKAQWTVFSGPGRKNAATHVSNITERLKDRQYNTMVVAINQAIGQVSREIAREIAGRSKEGTSNPPAQVRP